MPDDSETNYYYVITSVWDGTSYDEEGNKKNMVTEGGTDLSIKDRYTYIGTVEVAVYCGENGEGKSGDEQITTGSATIGKTLELTGIPASTGYTATFTVKYEGSSENTLTVNGETVTIDGSTKTAEV